ncbi:hypothetical protein BC833DRAFT_586619 [Globomyces pollinis-pini]|nr:hypothetical protein BC833DRAFT_586619 [Globomyces pollinis-pini]
MDAASVKSLDGPVKVLDSKFNILGITSDEAPIDVLSCHSKSVALTSNSGEIELKEIRSINAIRLHSDTGNINIVGRFTTNTWTQSHFAPLQSGLSGMTLHGYEEDVKLTGVVSARTVTGTISCSMQNFEVLDIYSAKGDISLDGTRKAPSIVQQAVLKSREGNIDVKTVFGVI